MTDNPESDPDNFPMLDGRMNVALEGSTLEAAGVVIPYSRTLIVTARRLMAIGDSTLYGQAVIIAQTGSEVAVAKAIAQVFHGKDLSKFWTEARIKSNLGNERDAKIYKAVTGDPLAGAPTVAERKKATELRNSAVHKGLRIEKAAAEEAIDVFSRIVDHVESFPSR